MSPCQQYLSESGSLAPVLGRTMFQYSILPETIAGEEDEINDKELLIDAMTPALSHLYISFDDLFPS